MTHWPAWITLGAPVKWWLANRAATSAVVFSLWHRFRAWRWFWLCAVLINIASLAALVAYVWWRRS